MFECEKDEETLAELTEKFRKGLEIKTRKWMTKSYEKCFVGLEAVEFMVKEGIAKTKEEAIEIGQLLVASNIIKHVTGDHDFKDEKLFYRFSVDEPSHGQTKQKEDGGNWSWSDYIPGAFKKSVNLNLQPDMKGLDRAVLTAEINTEETFGISPMDEHNQKLLDNVHPIKWEPPKPQKRYNLVAIGAGAAGLVSSAGCAGLGGKSAIIDKHLFGGDCLNFGCVPSKALLKAAKVASYAVNRAEEFGIEYKDKPKINFGKVMERLRGKRAEISHHDSCERFSKEFGMDVFLGKAEFVSENTIKLDDGTTLEFARCVIATGGSPSAPNIKGLSEVNYLTNYNLWNLTELPPKLAIIGSGPIGCEMAQSFALFGSEVTVLNRSDRILGKEDIDAANVIKQQMEKDGVSFKTGLTFLEIKNTDKKQIEIIFEYTQSKQKESLIVDQLLLATGLFSIYL